MVTMIHVLLWDLSKMWERHPFANNFCFRNAGPTWTSWFFPLILNCDYWVPSHAPRPPRFSWVAVFQMRGGLAAWALPGQPQESKRQLVVLLVFQSVCICCKVGYNVGLGSGVCGGNLFLLQATRFSFLPVCNFHPALYIHHLGTLQSHS